MFLIPNFRLFPAITIGLLIFPVLAGLVWTALPAFGHLPAAGFNGPNLQVFADLLGWSGFWPSVKLTITTGVLATFLSTLIAMLILSAGAENGGFQALRRFLSPLLSVPHAAGAFGLAFLIGPSGWIVRLFSPWATGWDRPPDVAIIQDPLGLAMVLGLVIKETPFLFLMGLAALGQTDGDRSMAVARALGYGQTSAWFKVVFPQVYRQIRLPVLAVLAYSLSVVDVALILGPNTPPTLSVLILRWAGDPALDGRLMAAAAAMVQFLIVVFAIGFWRLVEVVGGAILSRSFAAGRRQPRGRWVSDIGLSIGAILSALVLFGLLILGVWSVAGFWGFPNILPDQTSLKTWARLGPAIVETFADTSVLAAITVGLALVLVVGCLQAEVGQNRRPGAGAMVFLYLPLLVPQTAFLLGLQTMMIQLGFHSGLLPVIIAHLVFVVPYVFVSLSDPFRAWDPRLGVIGAALGHGPVAVLLRLRLPMLLRPILTAAAVGFAVSVGQYLPTLLIGGGRIATLTTEAVALSGGGDRKAIAVWALMQTLAALLPFLAAIVVPAWVWRHRKGV